MFKDFIFIAINQLIIQISQLPERKTIFPREKPVPKPKPLSKWQEYKKTKGLQTRKKDKMVWDEQAKEFRPRWGYKRANDSNADKNWFKELPKGVPMPEDPFEKERNAKKERVAKNELQRLRNVARSEKMTIPHQPSGAAFQSADHLTKAFHEVTRSTASLGKFQEKVRDEPKDFRPGKKQKFASNLIDSSTERKNQLKIIDDMLSNKPTLNKEKAGDRQIRAENREKNMSKAEKIKKGKKPRKAWLPPEKYEKSKKIEAMRAEKRERKGLPPKKSTLKKAMGGKGAAKGKAGKGGKGGKGAGKTAKMLKRAK